ncbi:hypothetical protein CR513_62338, partial [Mucuna pruriens]
MGPSARDMTVFTNVSSDNRFPVLMVAETASETESRVEVPRVFARAKGTLDVELRSVVVVDGSPNAGLFEVVENPSEEHVVAILLGVDAAGPVADIQAVVAELPGEKLAALLPPQIPIPGGQVRVPGDLPAFDGDASVAETGAADGELEEGGPGGGRIGSQGREGLGTLVLPAEMANEG